jgi:hypothetical protein
MFSEESNFALAAILRLTQSSCIRYIRITITKGRLTAMFVENENDVNRMIFTSRRLSMLQQQFTRSFASLVTNCVYAAGGCHLSLLTGHLSARPVAANEDY